MSSPVTVDGLVLSPTLLRPARGPVCRLEVCGGGCCVGGIWVDVLHIQRILGHASAIAAYLPSDRRDADSWFTDEVMAHSDFASGLGTPTATGLRPDGSGRQGCVFLCADNTCALQHVSVDLGLGWPGLKPRDCATFPLLVSEGRAAWDRSVRHVAGEADCKPPTAPAGQPFFSVFRAEAELALGARGVARLEAWSRRRQRSTRPR
jgi:hypothetical protein